MGTALVHLWQQQREIEAYLPNQGPFFVAAGTGPNVPCYLRWSGKRLLQRRWPKTDTERMVEDIWKKKRMQNEARDREGKALMGMDEFLLQYMQMKYGLEHLVAENTYNFLDACKRNIYDSDMALFLAVLHGHMGEDEILQQQAELETIANAMVDKKGNEASISIATGVQMLPKLFVTRRQQQLEELKDALTRSIELRDAGNNALKGKDFKLSSLLESDGDGYQTPFAECIRCQHLNEPTLFMAELRKQITHALLHERGDIHANTVSAELI